MQYPEEELRSFARMLEDPQCDWSGEGIQFVLEEVADLESLGACLLPSQLVDLEWSERTRPERIEFVCRMSRGRLVPSMFPLLSPRGPRCDFSLFVLPLHYRSRDGSGDENHWSLLAFDLDADLAEHAGTGSVRFFHFDSISEYNRAHAVRWSAAVVEHLVGSRGPPNVSEVSLWPQQSAADRTCGWRACCAAQYLALRGGVPSARPHLDLAFAECARDLRRRTLSRLAGCASAGADELALRLVSLYSSKLALHSLRDVGRALRWAAQLGDCAPFVLDGPAGGFRRGVGRWSPVDNRLDLYALGVDPLTEEEARLLDRMRAEAGIRAEVHLVVGLIEDSKRRCWALRMLDYFLRSGRRRLALTTAEALSLGVGMPRSCLEQYAASRPHKAPAAIAPTPQWTPSTPPPASGFGVLVAHHGGAGTHPLAIRTEILRALFRIHQRSLASHAPRYAPGIDYCEIAPRGNGPSRLLVRMGPDEVERLARALSTLASAQSLDDADAGASSSFPAYLWKSPAWLVSLLSFAVHSLQ